VELPESLAVKPNIPWSKQTVEQLKAERAYWEARINEATGWGASVGVAAEFLKGCDIEIARRNPKS
jgi:hypothetical protein